MLKRGISSVVTTILIVLLILAGIATIWFVVNNLLLKGSESVSLSNFGIDMVVESVRINYTEGMAKVKVARNPGLSDEKVIGLKFIVEDDRSAEILEVRFPENPFKELEKRTFDLNLTQSPILNIYEIWRISVAPIYISDISGKEKLGPVTNEYGLQNVPGGGGTGDEGGICEDGTCDINETFESCPADCSDGCGDGTCDINETFESCPADCEAPAGECIEDSDCGTNYWIVGAEICNGDGTIVMQYMKIYECLSNFCNEDEILLPIETCEEPAFCYAGACISDPIPCSQENVTADCGESGYTGFPYCSTNPPPEEILENYIQIDCVAGECVETINTTTILGCPGEQICALSQGAPECFDPIECVTNNDCALGEICVLGFCETELIVITGTIESIWPFTLGEYFDSEGLPNIRESISYLGYKIIFPGSGENRCLSILEYVYPDSPIDNAYIRLNKAETNISSGNNFEVWETGYICSTL